MDRISYFIGSMYECMADKKIKIQDFLKNHYNIITNIFASTFSDDCSNKNIIIIATARYDENGALLLRNPINYYSLLKHKNTKIKHIKIGNMEELAESVKSIKNQYTNSKIKALWISAHSNPAEIALGTRDKKIVDPENDDFFIGNREVKISKTESKGSNVKILKPTIDNLDKDAIIVLDSCEAGYVGENCSVAQSIAEIASGRLVYASTKTINFSTCKGEWKKDPESNELILKFRFTKERRTNKGGFKGKIVQFFYDLLNCFGLDKEDVTAKFRKYKQKENKIDADLLKREPGKPAEEN